MIKRYMTVQDALRLVRSKREVCPNPGFLQQLCQLHERLKKDGHYVTFGVKKEGKKDEVQENEEFSERESPPQRGERLSSLHLILC